MGEIRILAVRRPWVGAPMRRGCSAANCFDLARKAETWDRMRLHVMADGWLALID
jgi:hypothetical protein